jgi:hypothetical protein
MTAGTFHRYVIHFSTGHGASVPASLTLSSAGHRITRRELLPSRAFDEKDPNQQQFRLVESQYLRMMRGSARPLKMVELLINPMLVDKFNRKQAEFKKKGISDEVVLSFHGTTSREAVESIVANNFDVSKLGAHTGNKGAYGAGIYFSDFPSTSMGYGGATNMLMCRLLPGEVTDVGPCLGAPIKGNSHRTGARGADGYGQELVIPTADQILPCYILHFA